MKRQYFEQYILYKRKIYQGYLGETWIHIKCKRWDQNDYKFHQDNPDKSFFCIKCTAQNIAFSSLNDNQFEICVKNGINYLPDTDISFKPSDSDQRLFNKLNNAINNNAFDVVQEDNEENNDLTIDCNYYSLDESTSAKFNASKSFSIIHLNIHSIALLLIALFNLLDNRCQSYTNPESYTPPNMD
jgi:hypothetical protein